MSNKTQSPIPPLEYRALDDLVWCLTPEEITDNSIWKQLSQYAEGNIIAQKPLLLIRKNKKGDIKQLDIFSNGKTAILKMIKRSRYADLEISLNINIQREEYINHLCIKADESTTEAMTQYLGDIFSNLLITGRPLRYYNCTFFLPLDLVLDSEISMQLKKSFIQFTDNDEIERYKLFPPESLLKKEIKPSEDNIAHAQAYEYFHSHIQEQLFETVDYRQVPAEEHLRPIIHRRIKQEIVKNLTLRLIDKNDRTNKEHITTAQIEDVSLYEYYNGMLLLGIRVGLPQNQYSQEITPYCWLDKKDKDYEKKKQYQKKLKVQNPDLFNLICDETNWWQSLVYSNSTTWQNLQSLQVENWLRYSKLVRILYANFFEQLKEFKIAPIELLDKNKSLAKHKVNDAFSPVILYFIKQFINISELTRNKRLKQITDERMFTHSSYVLAGTTPKQNTPAEEEFERLFSYALYVDQRTDGYDNAQGWAYDKSYLQQRLKKQTIQRWKSISSLSGYTDYSTVFMGFGGWFQNPTATVHVPYIYAKMQIQVLFYRLTLQHLDRCISVATKNLKHSNGQSESFTELRLSVIEFTNEYWFRELTPQIQGKEITTLMIEQQELNEKYELLKDKLERANDYTTTAKDFWLQEKAVFVAWVAASFAVLTFFPDIINGCLNSKNDAIGAIATVGIILLGVTLYIAWKDRKKWFSKLFRSKK